MPRDKKIKTDSSLLLLSIMLTPYFRIFIIMKYANTRIAIENIMCSNTERKLALESLMPEKKERAKTASMSSIISMAISNGTSFLLNISFCSSTVVVIKVLEQKEMFKRKEVPLLIAILIIEDILAVFALTFFSGIKDSSASFLSVLEHIIFSIAILVFAYLVTLKLLKYGVSLILKNN